MLRPLTPPQSCNTLQNAGAGLLVSAPIPLGLVFWVPEASTRVSLVIAALVLVVLGQVLQHMGVDFH
jgi:hypothetical protein